MFPLDVWLTYTAACMILVVAPGPDNLLAVGRGLSQGAMAAWVSALSSGTGILVHVLAAVLGVAMLAQASAIAFTILKMAGAAYLIWLGLRVLRTQALVTFAPAKRSSLRGIFVTGFLSAVLNPKPGLFILAFVPQFVSVERGMIWLQLLGYGLWFAILTTLGFGLMGSFSGSLAARLRRRPRIVAGLNIGAGVTFIASGLSIAAMRHASERQPVAKRLVDAIPGLEQQSSLAAIEVRLSQHNT